MYFALVLYLYASHEDILLSLCFVKMFSLEAWMRQFDEGLFYPNFEKQKGLQFSYLDSFCFLKLVQMNVSEMVALETNRHDFDCLE